MSDYMTSEEAARASTGMTFEKVWDAMMESNRKRDEDWARILEERAAQEKKWEAERAVREQECAAQEKKWEEERAVREQESAAQQKTREELDRRIERRLEWVTKNLGGLGNSIGELTQAMFYPELCEKFQEAGFDFTSLGPNRTFKLNGKFIAEADFYLENGEYVMVVEIKTKLTLSDIDGHVERLSKIRMYMDVKEDKRTLVGAIAGGVATDDTVAYAFSQGLFALVQSGDAVTIADIPDGFAPRQWREQFSEGN